jgi:hypothetical protein
MPDNSGDFPLFPDGNPNAETAPGFDAFRPAEPGVTANEQTATADPTYFAYPPTYDSGEAAPPAQRNRFRSRSVAVLAGVVIVVGGVAAGAYAAFSSPSPGQSVTAGVSTPTVAATAATNSERRKADTARVTITSVSGSTLTGTTAAGESITVNITAETKFGTKAHPFSESQLVPGVIVIMRGERIGVGKFDATLIVGNITAGGGASDATASATPAA